MSSPVNNTPYLMLEGKAPVIWYLPQFIQSAIQLIPFSNDVPFFHYKQGKKNSYTPERDTISLGNFELVNFYANSQIFRSSALKNNKIYPQFR